jgi:hypothetical protein
MILMYPATECHLGIFLEDTADFLKEEPLGCLSLRIHRYKHPLLGNGELF